MTSILLANLWRRPARTAFTALGIAMGVATVVALLSLGEGLKQTAAGLVKLGNTDFAVLQTGVEGPTASFLSDRVVQRVADVEGVQSATPVMLLAEKFKADPGALLFGTGVDSTVNERLVMVDGRKFTKRGEMSVGDKLAEVLGVGVGDKVKVEDKRFDVVGIHHAGQFFVDTGAMVTLKETQELLQRPGEVTLVAVQVAGDARMKEVQKAISTAVPGVDTIANPDEAVRAGANGELIRKTVLLLVTVALIIGCIGVANTMAMAVLERSSELALMSAVGWSPRQVFAIVIGEGIFISVLGAGVGLLLGALGAGMLGDALGVATTVEPDVTPWSIGRGLIIGLVIGIFGGLYPAYRVARAPAERLLARGA